MRPDPPGVEHEDPGQFLVAPTPPGPGPGPPRVAKGAGTTLATEAALTALVLAAEAERTAVVATRAADRAANRVRVEARAGRRRIWQALFVLAALALAALALAAMGHHPAGLP